jgi:hypothetical protein
LELETRLADENISDLPRGTGDDVPTTEYLLENRAAMLEAIQSAKKHFLEQRR